MEAWKEPVTYIVGLVTTVSGFVTLHAFGTRRSLADHKTYAAETFATKQEFNRGEDRMMIVLTRIETKLDDHIARSD